MGKNKKPKKLKKIAWSANKTAAENARASLPALADRFFEDGRRVVEGERPGPGELHKLRLKAKRFRYTLELFKPCHGPGLKQRLKKLKEIQDFLGAINDCETTAKMIPQPASAGPQQQKLRAFLQSRIEENSAAFLEHWRTQFDAAGECESWTQYLKNFAGRNHVNRKAVKSEKEVSKTARGPQPSLRSAKRRAARKTARKSPAAGRSTSSKPRR